MSDDTPSNSENVYNSQLLAKVIPGLWIGNVWSIKELRKMSSPPSSSSSATPATDWTVVSLLNKPTLIEMANTQVDALRQERSRAIHHVLWQLPDRSNAAFLRDDQLDVVLQAMDQSLLGSESKDCDRSCLVHCAFGVSRSAAVCVAWLLSRKFQEVDGTLQGALDLIRKVRPTVSPNLGFLAELRALEQCRGDLQRARRRLEGRQV